VCVCVVCNKEQFRHDVVIKTSFSRSNIHNVEFHSTRIFPVALRAKTCFKQRGFSNEMIDQVTSILALTRCEHQTTRVRSRPPVRSRPRELAIRIKTLVKHTHTNLVSKLLSTTETLLRCNTPYFALFKITAPATRDARGSDGDARIYDVYVPTLAGDVVRTRKPGRKHIILLGVRTYAYS